MNSKAVKRFVKHSKRILGIFAALLLFSSITDALNYIYVSDDAWSRILWHRFYEDKGKIDNVYLGSSHVYYNLNPMLLDNLNGQHNFNLATSGQRLNGSYYLLKEADRLNSLSHVYLELYFDMSIKTEYGNDPIIGDLSWNWKNIDYMEPSINKMVYTLSITGIDKYVDTFFPFVRYREQLNNHTYINSVISKKKDADYLAYRYRIYNEEKQFTEEYQQQGFHYITLTIPDTAFSAEIRIIEENPMGRESKEYICKIINYCQKRDIPITLFVAPMIELNLVRLGNYDYYINQVREIAEEYQVPFYDFNLAKEEYLSFQRNEHFRDFHHLNSAGADIFTPFFHEVVSQEFSENEKYFYTTYAEKIESTDPAIYGLTYKTAADETQNTVRIYNIASNREEEMEYRIIMTPNDGEQYIVQDFSTNKDFTVDEQENGICKIVARMKNDHKEVQTMEIEY
ncbi:MAG: hypothetical protein J1D87_05300 [Lachnospiraceae bacterium]|nr:hypothetical protein [Lachnospiraceae bacterium]